jgi:hypothetical protein
MTSNSSFPTENATTRSCWSPRDTTTLSSPSRRGYKQYTSGSMLSAQGLLFCNAQDSPKQRNPSAEFCILADAAFISKEVDSLYSLMGMRRVSNQNVLCGGGPPAINSMQWNFRTSSPRVGFLSQRSMLLTTFQSMSTLISGFLVFVAVS